MPTGKNPLGELKGNIEQQKKISQELNSLLDHLQKAKTEQEKNMIASQIQSLKDSMKQSGQEVSDVLGKAGVAKPLNPARAQQPMQQPMIQPQLPIQQPMQMPEKKTSKKEKSKLSKKEKSLLSLEKETLKRLKKKKKKTVKKKVKKPRKYAWRANKLFSDYSISLLKKGKAPHIEEGIIKSKIPFVPSSYVSVVLFTTILSAIVAFLIFLFLLFFKVSVEFPFISMVEEGFGLRLLKIFWILIAIPLATFLFMYFYPSMEQKAVGKKIDQELPFATLHMAAISGSMIDPSKIFNIIVSTKEYPYLEKEFTRLINQIHIYGYDLISSLKSVAINSPSKRLSELLNGLATTISSGGNLPDFFQERSETLMFEYKIGKEKYTKMAETFMDIYISVVIAAPMILMLLMIMMRISGLGVGMSTSTITTITVLGVFLVNIAFLSFLHLKKAD